VFRQYSGHATRIPISTFANSILHGKRMSTVIRTPEGKIKLYCKVLIRSSLTGWRRTSLYTEKTLLHLEVRLVLCFSCQISVQTAHRCRRTTRRTDFRTLCLAFRIYRKQSTSNGRLFMTGQLLRSTAVRCAR